MLEEFPHSRQWKMGAWLFERAVQAWHSNEVLRRNLTEEPGKDDMPLPRNLLPSKENQLANLFYVDGSIILWYVR